MKKSIDLNRDWNQWFKSHWFKSANPVIDNDSNENLHSKAVTVTPGRTWLITSCIQLQENQN